MRKIFVRYKYALPILNIMQRMRKWPGCTSPEGVRASKATPLLANFCKTFWPSLKFDRCRSESSSDLQTTSFYLRGKSDRKWIESFPSLPMLCWLWEWGSRLGSLHILRSVFLQWVFLPSSLNHIEYYVTAFILFSFTGRQRFNCVWGRWFV